MHLVLPVATLLAYARFAAGGSETVASLGKRYVEEVDGVKYNVLEHKATGAKLSYVKNSGICETTSGVNQYSGYLSVGRNKNMFFWFFEARHNAKTAPFAVWFDGAPGCSSMKGLFVEHGPCYFGRVHDENEHHNRSLAPSLNPFSWNEYANMLYIDQPIGAGFSYGAEIVNNTESAAVQAYKLLQAFYTEFPQYRSRELGVWTESYGGQLGPELTMLIRDQNAALESGSPYSKLRPINQVALGIYNGWIDPKLQYKSLIDFSYQNKYQRLINATQRDELYRVYNTECKPQLDLCNGTGTAGTCQSSKEICDNVTQRAVTQASGLELDVNDIRHDHGPQQPSMAYEFYLGEERVRKAIGAQKPFSACEASVQELFSESGAGARSFLAQLSEVVRTGMKVLLWAGDADWLCNWVGNLQVAEGVSFLQQGDFRARNFTPYMVNGTEKGSIKSVDNLTFLKVYAAGHDVPYWQPELSLQVFKQTMQQLPMEWME